MSSLLQRRFTCFYCGCKSAQKQNSHIRQWLCKKCEATNFLDENGDITDPPAPDVAPPVQYAHTIPRAGSPATDNPLFCQTCLQNQHFLTQSLASYLPPVTDPNYALYEATYPEYRANLEKRYPQVCVQCEPRVRAKIQASGYLAKTDHLRRMMEKTRNGVSRLYSGRWDWRNLIVLLGALAWWTSLVGQILWNSMGATATLDSSDGLRVEDATVDIRTCLDQLLQRWETEEGCALNAAPFASLGLILGILSIWWNNRLSEKVRGTGGRMVGLSEYYKLQIITLVSRVMAWWLLSDRGAIGMRPLVVRGAHGVMLLFSIASAFFSLRTVRIDHTPRFSFHDNYEPLVVQDANPSGLGSSRASDATAGSYQLSRFGPKSPTPRQPFPVNRLASPAQTNYQSHNGPPTPPPESFETDSMDWTPTQKSFNPATPRPITHAPIAPTEPSPFHGRIPPAPISKAHRLRNPQSQLSFRKASEQNQQNFFNSVTRRSWEDESDEESPSRGSIDMAAPKFFPQADKESTGLENIFDATFSLGDVPKEVRERQQSQSERSLDEPNLNQETALVESSSPFVHVLFACLLILSLLGFLGLFFLRATGVLHVFVGSYGTVGSF